MAAVDELREKVAMSCRMLGTRGVTRGYFGHVSARVPGTDQVLIKSRGPEEEALEFATTRDVITLNLAGETLEAAPGLTAPAETAMHLAVYRARPEVMSVIHTHPHWVVVLTACDKPLVGMYGAYDGTAALSLLEEGIPVYQGTQTIVNDALGEDMMRVMGNRRVCLLRGHGMAVAGRSVEETTSTSFAVHELAYLNYLAYAIGGPLPVPDLDKHRERWATGRRRQPAGMVNQSGEPADWRYGRRLLERLDED